MSESVQIVIVGDSTVATNRPGNSSHGWGGVVHGYFIEDVTVINLAVSGRSSKSFIGEGLWEDALTRGADYIFIQFGHNDCPGKGDRETDPKTDFRDYIRKYVDDGRKIGAVQVLITPVTRRRFDETGQIRTILAPYAEGMRIVAGEKGVPLIDLHVRSMDLFNRLGDDGSLSISATPDDRTHFSLEGARVVAGLVVDALPECVAALRPYLKSQ